MYCRQFYSWIFRAGGHRVGVKGAGEQVVAMTNSMAQSDAMDTGKSAGDTADGRIVSEAVGKKTSTGSGDSAKKTAATPRFPGPAGRQACLDLRRAR
jgi:hypothetical protein